jgi:hypothetical protein
LVHCQQNELPVHALVAEMERISKLLAHLGRMAEDVDVDIGGAGLMTGKVMENTVVALDQSSRMDVEAVTEYDVSENRTVHSIMEITQDMTLS